MTCVVAVDCRYSFAIENVLTLHHKLAKVKGMADNVVTPLPAQVRRERMLAFIAEREFARVSDLSQIFNISEVTVRSDLDCLHESEQLMRIRGGAVMRTNSAEPSFEEASGTYADEKRAIAQRAAEMVTSDSSVFLDVGTTTTLVAKALADRADLENVVVITNGLTIALELERAIPALTVIVTGGTLRPRQHSLVDPMLSAALENLHADLAFIGCNGVDVDGGITNINLPEAAIKKRMVSSASRTVVVADGSKLGRVHLGRVVRLENVNALITGGSAPKAELEAINKTGLEVIRVGQ